MSSRHTVRAARAALVALATSVLLVAAHLAVAPAALAAPTLRADRSYGAGPVTVPGHRTRAQVAFTGRRGDVVTLAVEGGQGRSRTVLKQAGRRVKETWDGFWRLPRNGRYTFVSTQQRKGSTERTLQLQKVRVRAAKVEKTRKMAPARRGYLNAVAFDLARDQRLLLTTRSWGATVLAPRGQHTRATAAQRLQLEAGEPVRSTAGFVGSSPLRAGRVLVLVDPKVTTALTESVVAKAEVGGAARAIESPNALPREFVLDFPADQEQLVRVRGVGGVHGTPSFVSADGSAANLVHGLPLMWITAKGTQRLSVITTVATSTSVGLEDVAVVGTANTDDGATTLVTPAPGRWVATRTDNLANVFEASGPTFADTTGAASDDWSVVTATRSPFYCELEWNPPNGCGNYFPVSMDASALRTEGYYNTGDLVVLRVGEGVGGMVSVRLGKKPA